MILLSLLVLLTSLYFLSRESEIEKLKRYADENSLDLDIHYCHFTKVWSVHADDIGFDVYLDSAIQSAVKDGG